jgi:predicted MFS family arabinose efflux permease
MSDHLPANQLSRAAGVYSGSFILATALSFPLGAWVGHIFGWWAPFIVCSATALMAPVLVFAGLPQPAPRAPSAPSSRWLLDFRPVFANHAAVAYSWCYGLHCWELFAVRTWMVAFLSFSLSRDGEGMSMLAEMPLFAPANIAAAAMILGFFANLLGNELAIRIGRLRAISRVMVVSATVCLAVPQLGEISYWLAAIACMVHGMTLLGESTACTAGALGNAPKDLRGATMALHSTIGFTGGFLGPLVFGLLLDAGGGQSQFGWTIAYAHLAVVILLGPIVLRLFGAGKIAGDRA